MLDGPRLRGVSNGNIQHGATLRKESGSFTIMCIIYLCLFAVLVTDSEVIHASVGVELQFQYHLSCELQFLVQLLPGFAIAHTRVKVTDLETHGCGVNDCNPTQDF